MRARPIDEGLHEEVGAEVIRLRVAGMIIAAAMLGALALAAQAAAATFTMTPVPQTTNGAGPFTWSFVSNGNQAYSWVAYKLSTEAYWHRCVPNGVVTLENLPIGTYSIEVTDDVDLEDWAARGLGNSLDAQACHMSPPPESPYVRRISSFSVIAPPIVTSPTTPTTPTGGSQPGPTTPPPATSQPPSSGASQPGSDRACTTARQTERNVRARWRQAVHRTAAESTPAKKRFWRGIAGKRRAALEREEGAVSRLCN
jgi:hypothetical protein